MTEPIVKRRRGPARPGGGKRKNRDTRKQARRDAAAERQATYDALSHAEKVARAWPNSNEMRKLQGDTEAQAS